MKILISLCCLVLYVHCKAVEEKKCLGVHVRDKIHRKEVLIKGINKPYQLALLKKDHKLFYSYNVGARDSDTFDIAYITKIHTEPTSLKDDVENGFALAADNEHHAMYCGGSNGIFKYHGHTQKIEMVVKDKNIWDMFYGKHLYFINFPEHHLYKYSAEHNKTERVKEIKTKIYNYVIDKDGDQFFSNDTGLFRIKNGSKHAASVANNEGPYRAMELDNNGEAHFCGKHGIYVVEKDKNALKLIVNVNDIFGLTFDHDNNIIYSDPHEIVHLLPGECS